MHKKEYPLICRACEAEYNIKSPLTRCVKCGQPLSLPYINDGRIINADWQAQRLFLRYGAFYPYFEELSVLSLGEGFTPLLEMPELADETGADRVYIKNESLNPTWSFKDRGTAAGVRRAMQLGFRSIGTVSSGNMGLSVAAYGKRAGLKAFILVSADIPQEKLLPISIYNPYIIKVAGGYDELYDKSLEIAKTNNIYFINSDEPFRIEGYKTLAYEIAEQLNYNMPDYIIVPVSSAGHIMGIYKGLKEMQMGALITKLPTMVAVQAQGCAPIARAYAKGEKTITREKQVNTIAHAIKNPYPPSGEALLAELYKNNGLCYTVSDEEMLLAQREIAEKGLFVQMESASTYAALKRMGQDGLFCARERVVCVATSAGFKYTKALENNNNNIYEATQPELEGLIKKLNAN